MRRFCHLERCFALPVNILSEVCNRLMTEDSKEMNEPMFSVLRRGAKKPGGPYTGEEIVEMLNQEAISRKDFVFFEGAKKWKPLDEVFDIAEEISHFVDEGQDQQLVDQVFGEISSLLKSGEEIYYIALQTKDEILTRVRQSVVVSSHHLYHLTQKDVGYGIEAHLWTSIKSFDYLPADDGLMTIRIGINKNRKVEIPYIPFTQAERLVELWNELHG